MLTLAEEQAQAMLDAKLELVWNYARRLAARLDVVERNPSVAETVVDERERDRGETLDGEHDVDDDLLMERMFARKGAFPAWYGAKKAQAENPKGEIDIRRAVGCGSVSSDGHPCMSHDDKTGCRFWVPPLVADGGVLRDQGDTKALSSASVEALRAELASRGELRCRACGGDSTTVVDEREREAAAMSVPTVVDDHEDYERARIDTRRAVGCGAVSALGHPCMSHDDATGCRFLTPPIIFSSDVPDVALEIYLR